MQPKPNEISRPRIGKGTYISEGAVIIGNVSIGNSVFIAPNAVIRADEEKSSIHIEDGCNIQDGVIIHALNNSVVNIGRGTSLSHGCIVHGPCNIGEECFIGFGATVFNSEVGKGSFVNHRAIAIDVKIPPGKLVQGDNLLKSHNIKDLPDIPEKLKDFKESVKTTNQELIKKYKYCKYEANIIRT